MKAWIQLRELAATTGLSKRTLRAWTASGRLPSAHLGPRGWHLFGATTIETLERMGVPVDLSILAEPSDLSIDEPDGEP